MPTYYDAVLGLIPLTFVGAIGVGAVVGIATLTAIAAAALLATGLIIHAMFVNPPSPVRYSEPAGRSTNGSANSHMDAPTEFAD